MKKLILLLFLSVSFTVFSQETKWYDNYEKAAKAAQRTNKPILANFTGSDWCGWCIQLDKQVFSTKEFEKWADKNVILLTVDFPRKKEVPENIKAQNYGLQQAFQVRGYPTVMLFSPGKGEDPKKGIVKHGKTGYVAGGPLKWIESIEPALPN